MNSLINISVKSSLFILISAVFLLLIQNSCSDIARTDSFELGPGIKSVIPARGPLGAQITINGKGFGISASDVQLYFNSSKASIESLRDTTIFTRVPKDAKSGTIQVIVNGDTLAGPAFTVDTTKTLFLNIENVTPLAGSPGDVVNIAGTGFKSVPVQNKVFFNDAAAVVKSASETLLKAVVPSDAKTGNINVVVEQDTAKGPVFAVDAQGALQVRISTTGENQDENGYLLAIDDSEGTRTQTTDTITRSKLKEGSFKVELTDIASNCTLINDVENPRTVKIVSGKTTTTEYDISCKKENVKPVVSFTYSCENLNCKFDGSGSSDSDGTIKGYNWIFGDGTSGTGKTTSHGYELAGSYTVQLTVTDNEGASGSISKEVTVTLPEIKNISPESGPRGTEVVITGSGFSANKSDNKVTFTSGSGQINTPIKSASVTQLVVDVPGDATTGPVSVKVFDYVVQGPTFSVEVNEGPEASFIYACENLDCKLDASDSNDSDGSIIGYAWNFDDGKNDTGKNTSHSFEEPGTYNVKLTVTDDEGATGIVSKEVTVTLPEIKNISPTSGSRGIEVTITGSGFSAQTSDNKVSFTSGSGEVNASVKSASETKLVVDVPGDATSGPVYVSTYGYKVKGPIFSVEVNEGPEAFFVYACENLDCKFDASDSNDSDGSITGYSWEFGDGTKDTGKSTSHGYEVPGTYTVMLTVTDNEGATGSISKEVTVTLPEIKNISPESGPRGTEVTITGSGFSGDKLNDKVTFTSGSGEVDAPIKSATETKLVVDVPGDATGGAVYVSVYGYKVKGPNFNVVTTGGIKVNISTTGPDQDPNGYNLILDGGDPSSVDINDVVTFNSLQEGSHSIKLADIASNCMISQDRANPYNVDVTAGETTTTNVDVSCESAAPTISSISPESGRTGTEVTITGSGFSGDKVNDKVTFTSGSGEVDAPIKSATETKLVVDVPGDATSGPVYVTVNGYRTEGPTFTVVQVMQPKSLQVITETENSPPDLNGYTLSVSGKDTRFINPNDERTISNIFDDQVDVELSGVPDMCSVAGNNPRNIALDEPTTTTTFSITCTSPDPIISNISPESGPVGTEVTISGSGFSADKSDDEVNFTSGNSEVQATIKSASETELVVDVPSDATTGPVYVSTYGYRVSGPTFTVEQPKGMEVQVQTEGTEQDTDGYTISVVGKDDRTANPNDDLFYSNIYGDEVQVSISGVADNCRVDGENPRLVNLDNSDNYGYTLFTVDCTRDLRGQIIYISDPDGNNDIFTRNEQGNQVQQITETMDYEYLPKLSPNGLKIAYVAYAGERQIFIIDSDGSDVKQITNSGYYSDVSWSPDGTKLVVRRSDNSDAPADIYTMDIDGTNQQNITNTPTEREADPDWSADGSRIVYSNGNITSINPDGTNKVQLTSGSNDGQPEWSPDGTKIAFVRKVSGTRKIHIMNADGTGAYELTPSSVTESSPTWSPDGTKMAFAEYRSGGYNIIIYTVKFDDILSGSYTSTDDKSPHWNY